MGGKKDFSDVSRAIGQQVLFRPTLSDDVSSHLQQSLEHQVGEAGGLPDQNKLSGSLHGALRPSMVDKFQSLEFRAGLW